jgi:predicted nucleotidyltransferase
MTSKGEILATLRVALPSLRPIRSLAIFGSVARGTASAKSDLDVLVEFERPSLFPNSSRLKTRCRHWSIEGSIWSRATR